MDGEEAEHAGEHDVGEGGFAQIPHPGQEVHAGGEAREDGGEGGDGAREAAEELPIYAHQLPVDEDGRR